MFGSQEKVFLCSSLSFTKRQWSPYFSTSSQEVLLMSNRQFQVNYIEMFFFFFNFLNFRYLDDTNGDWWIVWVFCSGVDFWEFFKKSPRIMNSSTGQRRP